MPTVPIDLPKQFLFAMFQGSGNIPPILAVARQLVTHGHHVRVLAGPGLQPDRPPRPASATFLDGIHTIGATLLPLQQDHDPFDSIPPPKASSRDGPRRDFAPMFSSPAAFWPLQSGPPISARNSRASRPISSSQTFTSWVHWQQQRRLASRRQPSSIIITSAPPLVCPPLAPVGVQPGGSSDDSVMLSALRWWSVFIGAMARKLSIKHASSAACRRSVPRCSSTMRRHGCWS